MARTAEAHRRQVANKRKRSSEERDVSWQIWRKCHICERQYCANNYQDRKTRVTRWRGLEVCAHCRYGVVRLIPRLEKLKVVKVPKQWKK